MGLTRHWKAGCGFGCGIPLLLAAMALLGIVLISGGISEQAIATRGQLESLYPSHETFRPPAEDKVGKERLDRFLQVRKRLAPYCEPLELLARNLKDTDARARELESQTDDELAARDFGSFLAQALGAGRSLVDVAQSIAEYGRTRNEALLEAEMGQGEYIWIYAVTYFGLLEQEPRPFALEKLDRARIFQDRIRGSLIDMMRWHLEDLGKGAAPPETIAYWEQEVHALEVDPERLPFASGLPPTLQDSLENARDDLLELACPEASELDFMRIEKQGLRFEHL